jgi:hypothetical protein
MALFTPAVAAISSMVAAAKPLSANTLKAEARISFTRGGFKSLDRINPPV